jgi:hypothetical protein
MKILKRAEVVEIFNESVKRLLDLNAFVTDDQDESIKHLSGLNSLMYATRCLVLPIPKDMHRLQQLAVLKALKSIAPNYTNFITEVSVPELSDIFSSVKHYLCLDMYSFVCSLERKAGVQLGSFWFFLVRPFEEFDELRGNIELPINDKNSWRFMSAGGSATRSRERAQLLYFYSTIRHFNEAIFSLYDAAANTRQSTFEGRYHTFEIFLNTYNDDADYVREGKKGEQFVTIANIVKAAYLSSATNPEYDFPKIVFPTDIDVTYEND